MIFATRGSSRRPIHFSRPAAFTVVELLTVLTILAILVALLIPSLGSARRAAQRAQTKVQFAQWIGALEAFRREYGSYPALDPSGLVNAGAATTGSHFFHDLLAGCLRDGGELPVASDARMQNPRLIAFHAFSDAELDRVGSLRDASENTSIAVLVDRNLDGAIRIGGENADYGVLPKVTFADGTTGAPALGDAPGQFPLRGLRSSVAFYSPAPGSSGTAPDFVTSW